MPPAWRQRPGSFGQRGAGGEDVVDDDAGPPADVRREEPAPDPHGAADPLRRGPRGPVPSARRPARQRHQCTDPFREISGSLWPLRGGPPLAEGVRQREPAPRPPLRARLPQQEMDRAEAPFPEGAVAAWAPVPGRIPASSPAAALDGPAQCLGQHRLELALAVLLEGQHRLGQFLAVDPGSHDRKEDRPSTSMRAGACASARNGCLGQEPDLPFAGAAERQILRSAADTVHRGGQRQELAAARLLPGPQPAAATAGSRRGASPASRQAAARSGSGSRRQSPCQRLHAWTPGHGSPRGAYVDTAPAGRHRHADDARRKAVPSARERRVARSLQLGDQPFPSRWKIPSADWPKISSGPLPALRAVSPGQGASCWGCDGGQGQQFRRDVVGGRALHDRDGGVV